MSSALFLRWLHRSHQWHRRSLPRPSSARSRRRRRPRLSIVRPRSPAGSSAAIFSWSWATAPTIRPRSERADVVPRTAAQVPRRRGVSRDILSDLSNPITRGTFVHSRMTSLQHMHRCQQRGSPSRQLPLSPACRTTTTTTTTRAPRQWAKESATESATASALVKADTDSPT